jgi:hypothetical protein
VIIKECRFSALAFARVAESLGFAVTILLPSMWALCCHERMLIRTSKSHVKCLRLEGGVKGGGDGGGRMRRSCFHAL